MTTENTTPAKTARTRKAPTTPKAETATASKSQAVEIIHCVDVGNYSIKAVQGQTVKPVIIRSLLVDPTHYKKQQHSPDSPLILIDGKQYHFGKNARDYGIPVKPLVLSDKNEPDLFKAAVLSTIQPSTDGDTLTVRLRLTVPNGYRDEVESALKESLLGKHSYIINGLNVTVTVLSVDIYLEGVPSYAYAKSLDRVPEKGYTLLIDIGGGTFNVLTFNANGVMVGQPQSTHQGGGIALAQRIAQVHSLGVALNSRPDLSIIQDGITDGSNQYGQLDVSWDGVMDELTEQWFAEGMSAMFAMCAAYLPSVTKILFTGGNAELLRPWIEKAAINEVIPNPTLSNVLGLASME